MEQKLQWTLKLHASSKSLFILLAFIDRPIFSSPNKKLFCDVWRFLRIFCVSAQVFYVQIENVYKNGWMVMAPTDAEGSVYSSIKTWKLQCSHPNQPMLNTQTQEINTHKIKLYIKTTQNYIPQ